ncbi:hypothetical protein B9G53_09675 [Pseudanabaena sp. SR411]|uniref:hypothetical protein n=1 Tax=Pseudanabaena sp. SR411 TaxID=1980935 RepID=UPI000B98368E|nr:hypothetical protein [Pseudanabaena sp. SR411]OYQ64889.1 hypothetical protein B9G53_09675 [Pseudanabaena sp. SR411]
MVNLIYSKNRILPTVEELQFSDETPVDKQLKNDIPNLLLSLLADIRYLTTNAKVTHAEAIANQERTVKQQAEESRLQSEQKAKRLMEKLREMGINPDQIQFA